MNLGDFLFALSGPLMMVVAALVTLWIASIQDAREDRRRAQPLRPGE